MRECVCMPAGVLGCGGVAVGLRGGCAHYAGRCVVVHRGAGGWQWGCGVGACAAMPAGVWWHTGVQGCVCECRRGQNGALCAALTCSLEGSMQLPTWSPSLLLLSGPAQHMHVKMKQLINEQTTSGSVRQASPSLRHLGTPVNT